MINYWLVALAIIIIYLATRKKETLLFWRAPESAVHDNTITLQKEGFQYDVSGTDRYNGSIGYFAPYS